MIFKIRIRPTDKCTRVLKTLITGGATEELLQLRERAVEHPAEGPAHAQHRQLCQGQPELNP